MRKAVSSKLSPLERQARALWMDQQYAAAAVLVEKDRLDAPPGLLDRALRLKHESEFGSHDVSAFYLEKRAPEHVADYIGPLEIRWSQGKGRGVFLTADAAVGDLLFVNNAVAAFAQEELFHDFDTLKGILVSSVLEQCWRSPRVAEQVRSMNLRPDRKQHLPSIGIYSPNSSVDISRSDPFKLDGTPAFDGGTDFWGNTFFGAWPFQSLINNSCCEANVSTMVIGNAFYGYASRDTAAGSELVRHYHTDLALRHYLFERKELLTFTCECPRCIFEKGIFDNGFPFSIPAETSKMERAWLMASAFKIPGSHRDDRGEWLETCGEVCPGSFRIITEALKHIANRPGDEEIESRMMELARRMVIQACGRQKEEVIDAIIESFE